MNTDASQTKHELSGLTEQPWFKSVQVGQMLQPLPLYNQTEREPNRLATPTKVLGVESCVCQSGVRFEVQTRSGGLVRLDAGWFEPPTRPT